MKPIDFEGSNCTYGEGQPQYLPLPVCRDASPEVRVTSCWELDEQEMQVLMAQVERGEKPRVWLTMATWGEALQPVLLTVERPEIAKVES